MEKLLTKIEVFSVKEIEYVDSDSGKKKKFMAYKAVTKANKLIDLRFTTDCTSDYRELLPTKPCYMYVPQDGYNVQRNVKYPILWVTKIDHLEDFKVKKDEDLF